MLIQAALEEHIAECNSPPKPDAICKYIECSGHYKIQIYLTDPDFKVVVFRNQNEFCSHKCSTKSGIIIN